MAVKTIKVGPGLWLDASTIEVPDGALRVAQNVMLDRTGLIRPRYGYSSAYTKSSDFRVMKMFAFRDGSGDTDTLCSTYDTSSYQLEFANAGTVFTNLASTPPGVSDSLEVQCALARGSAYITSTIGILKLADHADTTLSRAGAFTDYLFPVAYTAAIVSTNPNRFALDAQTTVAYRYVWMRKDANGYERRSPASSRWTVDNTSASKAKVEIDRVFTPLTAAVGDVLEVYRTKGVGNGGVVGGGVPNDEYFLALSYIVQSGEHAGGLIDIGSLVDDLPDEELGATLYVSPSQGGELANSKEPPPLCRDVAWWNGVLWGAHITERAALTIELVRVHGGTDRSWDALGIGWSFSAEATYTSGSPTVTIAPASIATDVVSAMKTGQYCTDNIHTPESAGTYVPANTTLSALATRLTLTAANIAADDTIQLGDIVFTWKVAAGSDSEVTIAVTDNGCATNLAAKINAYPWTSNFGTDANTGTWNLSATTSANTAIVVDATGYGVHPRITDGGGGPGVAVSYTMTMSANALASGSAKTFYATDWISLSNGTLTKKFYAYGSSYISRVNDLGLFLPEYRGLNINAGLTEPLSGNAANMALGINGYSIENSVNAQPDFDIVAVTDGPRLTLLTRYPSVGDITIQCSVRPDAFRPSLDSALSSSSRVHPGRLVWSQPQEPEAFAPAASLDVGDPQQPIDRIVALRDALLVFKRDGLYRVTGAPPDQWRVDAIDLTLWLQHPECVTTLENVCYAWTNRGVVTVTEAGLGDVISQPIQIVLRVLGASLPQGIGGPNRGFYMIAHPRLRLVILGVNESAVTGATASDAQYVYHLTTGAWSRWDGGYRSMLWQPYLGYMLVGGASEWRIHREQPYDVLPSNIGGASLISDFQDASVSLTQTSGSTTYTVAKTEVTPRIIKIGDIFDFGSGSPRYARVTAASLPNPFTTWTLTLDRVGTATGSVSAAWYSCIDSQLQWHAQTMGAPGVGGLWAELQALLESADAVPSTWPIEMGGQSHIQDRDATIDTVSPTIASPAAQVLSRPVRAGLPRAIVRSPQLYPYMRLRTALVDWALSAITLVGYPTSTRVTR